MNILNSPDEDEHPFMGAVLAHVTRIRDDENGLHIGGSSVSLADRHPCEDLTDRDQPVFIVSIKRDLLMEWADSCRECTFLLQVATSHTAGRGWIDTAITVVASYPVDLFFVSGRDKVKDEFNHCPPFVFFTDAGFVATKSLPFRVQCELEFIPGDTSLQNSISWCRKQIDACNTKHSCLIRSLPPLPTRVLDLRHIRSGVFETRLLAGSGQKARYVCLSHCWGKAALMAKTTSASLKAHMQSIPLSDLPKTFQDAIDITQKVGVDYLWIDSLCIVQDDEKDWARESSRMADIYENAYVTVGATASKNGTEGCYRRSPPTEVEKNFQYKPNCERHSLVYSVPPFKHFDLEVGISHTTGVGEFPLLSRAWVFQERFLSPRMLHFCNRELIFECRDGSQCQCTEKSSGGGSKQVLQEMLRGSDNLHPVQLSKGWWGVVRRYTRLGITFDKDLLPALSGIARRLAAAQPDEYYAGLWKAGLPTNLLWHAVDPSLEQSGKSRRRAHRAVEPRAPSWSWASIVGPISWLLPQPLADKRLLTRVDHVSCNLVDDDTYGRVHGGVLRVTGPTLNATLHWTGDASSRPDNHETPFFSLPELDAATGEISDVIYPDFPFYLNKTSPLPVLLLRINLEGVLILRPIEGIATYERVGLCLVSADVGEGSGFWQETVEIT